MDEGSICEACKRGSMVRNRVRRMNGFLVFVGFLLFVPSVLGILGGAIATVGFRIIEEQGRRPPAEIRAELTGLKVPDATIERLVAKESGEHEGIEGVGESMRGLSEGMEGLDPAQRDAVTKAWISKVGRELPMGTLVGSALTILVGSVVLGVVAFLLIRKRWVLQCTACPAVVPAVG
jgi:hypothetical protein